MNYILRGIVAASLMWPTVAGARDIDFQNFEQAAAHAPSFVLGEPKASSSSPLASTQANDRLADAFGALGDVDSPPLYFPRASLQQSPCFDARYQPSPGLSPAAERRRAVWFPSMAEAACRSGVPVPLLDGGHLLFYAFEVVRGRPLSERAQEIGFRVGLALVLVLMIFAAWNDILNLGASWRAT